MSRLFYSLQCEPLRRLCHWILFSIKARRNCDRPSSSIPSYIKRTFARLSPVRNHSSNNFLDVRLCDACSNNVHLLRDLNRHSYSWALSESCDKLQSLIRRLEPRSCLWPLAGGLGCNNYTSFSCSEALLNTVSVVHSTISGGTVFLHP